MEIIAEKVFLVATKIASAKNNVSRVPVDRE